ncbi:MAG TPA: hypothetical protein DCZ04_16690 [Syntrophorhabdus aromaticivorans]|nr:hypothetical protein [Syntrophorhabdus aromaticivorans]
MPAGFCSKCGKELQEDVIFCSSCGAKVGNTDTLPRRSAIDEILDTQSKAEADDDIRCPNCKSKNVAPMRRGYSGKNACWGSLLFGPFGLLCGQSGANKVTMQCLKCGNTWPVPNPKQKIPPKEIVKRILIMMGILVALSILGALVKR